MSTSLVRANRCVTFRIAGIHRAGKRRAQRHVIADLIRNPEGWTRGTLVRQNQDLQDLQDLLSRLRGNDGAAGSVMLASRQYPQGDTGKQDNTNHLSHGQPTTPAPVTDCTRTTHNNHPYPNKTPTIINLNKNRYLQHHKQHTIKLL